MAECSYARCLQERRLIKRELMKWSKDMLHIVGLERIAEELMERMKWKQCQEPLTTRAHISHTVKSPDETAATAELPPATAAAATAAISPAAGDIADASSVNTPSYGKTNGIATSNCSATGDEVSADQQQYTGISEEYCPASDKKTTSHNHNQLHHNNSSLGLNNKICSSNNTTSSSTLKATNSSHTITSENITSVSANEKNLSSTASPPTKPQPTPPLKAAEGRCVPTVEPVDWKPNKKCYFCVDGRLLTVNTKGELVAEPAGPVVSAAGGDLVEHGHRLENESDSNESSHVNSVNSTTTAAVVNPLIYNNNNSNNNNNSSTNNNTNNNNNNNNNRIDWNKLLTTRLVDLPANMTSMDSMAAQLAVISGYPNFNWLQLMQQQQQQQQQTHQTSTQQEQAQQQQQQQQQQTSSATPTTSETSAAAVSPPLKDSPSPSDATGEQPLDLSSKPSPNSSISGDLKAVRSRASRTTPTPSARHPYTDDAISNAVEDILSGKYSARKASDQYSGNATLSGARNRPNIPAMLGKSANAHIANVLLRGLEMDKDVSGDECAATDGSTGIIGGSGSNASTPQPEPANHSILEELANRLRAAQSLHKPGVNNGNSDVAARDGNNEDSSPRPNALYGDINKRDSSISSSATPQPQQSPQAGIDTTFAILQAFLFTLTSFGALQQRTDQPVTLRDLVANLKDMLDAHSTGDLNVEGLINNGKPNAIDQPLLPLKLQQHSKSDTPEMTSSIETHEQIGDELAASILKIPSYKPAAGTPTPVTGSTRASCSPSSLRLNSNANSMPNPNGDSPHSAPSPRIASSIFASNNGTSTSAGRQSNDISVISPPLLQHRQSPPSFSFRDVIARGIHRTMNEQSNQEAHAAAAAVAAASPMLGLCLEMDRSSNNNSESSSADHKKSTISVVKNIGGTDTTRFRAVPNVFDGAGVAGAPVNATSAHNSHGYHQAHMHNMHHHHPHHLSRQEAAALAAGKGTRPKRGKYRNYDRDSLIEAVRAVQRGEMSVHRAGSYFGVPHSTLEYKVKERHLMRPRKREPKPQPGLDGSSSSTSSKANSNIPGHHNNLGKIKLGNAAGTSASSKLNESLKSNSSTAAAAAAAAAFPTTAPNGMKLPIFDPMQYPAHLFWNHSPSAFSQMHMEFNRNAVVAQNASTTQRYNEDMLHGGASAGTPSSANSPSPIASPLSAAAGHALNMKNAREIAENLYESGGTNGSSILDGIIRKTLDRKSADVGPPQNVGTGGALLDQLLVKKSTLPPYVCNNNSDHISSTLMSIGGKRVGSPLPYTEIKRERGSPPHSSGDDDDEDASRSGNEEFNYEHNNNNHGKNSIVDNNELEQHHRQHLRTQQRSRSRSRLTSHDSAETDTNSIPSELMPNHNNSNKLGTDLNGSGGTSGAGVVGMVPKVETLVDLERTAAPVLGGTSILQEKLAQIKAEQENENNL